MTMITVRHIAEHIGKEARIKLSTALTDAVLEVELGQQVDAARSAFQVQFIPLAPDQMATNGVLCSESGDAPIYIDIAVMDGPWGEGDVARVTERVFSALVSVLGVNEAKPSWWTNFRIIKDGHWGSRGGITQISDFVGQNLFTTEKEAKIQARFNK